MVKRWPHKMTIYSYAAATKQENGDWLPGVQSAASPYECRFEVNKSNAVITGEDGSQVRYAGIIYSDAGAFGYQVGQRIVVTDRWGAVIVDDKIKQVLRGHLNNRLWV